jgi:uncharacterized protein YdhG (YjbR/CyaY superfamily)
VARPATVEEYFEALPDDRRAALEQLRAAIRAGAPEAAEQISYQMPAFRSHGQFLVSYAAYKRHYSLFPATEAVVSAGGDELKPHLTGKGTIQFRLDQPIPTELVTKIVKVRWAENEARSREDAARR